MADLSLVTDNYLPTASETFSDNLSGSITAGATIVPVNSAAEYADGETVVLTVEPGTSNEATFVGKKDTGVNQFIECIWTEGNTAVGHDAGVTIIDYDSATHYNLLSEALQLIMNQDGTLKDDPIRTALGLSDASNDGWEVFPYTFSVSSGYNKGQKEFDLTVANQDVRTLLSPGMKLRLERSTTAPTQCADFESSSSQYASRVSGSVTGVTFTDDFTCESWVKPESYTGNAQAIINRYVAANGWGLRLTASGQPEIFGGTGSAYDIGTSYQSVALNRWTHLAATLDMSGATSTIYINGVSVLLAYTNSGASSLTQGGDLTLGKDAASAASYFDGKISDVRVWSAVRTATQIRDNMNQALVGNETNLVCYWKLDGAFTDSTSNANTLTASGGVVATNLDHPMQSTEYVYVLDVSYSAPNSTVTVFGGLKNNVPNMTLTSPYYSTQSTPYGFPSEETNWRVETHIIQLLTTSLGALNTTYKSNAELIAPKGNFDVGWQGTVQYSASTGGTPDCFFGMGKDADNNMIGELTARLQSQASVTYMDDDIYRKIGQSNSVQTSYKIYVRAIGGSGTLAGILLASSASTTTPNTVVLFAQLGYK